MSLQSLQCVRANHGLSFEEKNDPLSEYAIKLIESHNIHEISKMIEQKQISNHTLLDMINHCISTDNVRSLEKMLDSCHMDVYQSKEKLLEYSIDCDKYESTKFLIESGANINNDLLFKAVVEKENQSITKLLLENGADIHYDDDNIIRECVVDMCIDFSMIKFLIDCGANIHADHDHALRYGCRHNQPNVIKVLLEAGADVHANDDEALQIAVFYGRIEVCQVLIDFGADVRAKNSTALLYSIGRRYTKIALLLLTHGADFDAINQHNIISDQHTAKLIDLLLENVDYRQLCILLLSKPRQIY